MIEHSKIPQWIVDDLSYANQGHTFVAHTHHPRFYGEIFYDDDLEDPPITGITLRGMGYTVAKIEWIDPPDDLDPEIINTLNITLEMRSEDVEGGFE